jgi:hypothetical protein
MEFSGEDFSAFSDEALDTISDEPQKSRKGGRPTVPDNWLLGGRNQWHCFFQECWPDIGWDLLQIRKRRSSTLADVQGAFERLEPKPNRDLARVFLRGSPHPVTPQKLRSQRIAVNKMLYASQDMQREVLDLQRSLAEAEDALLLANGEDRVTILDEVMRRAEFLTAHQDTLAVKQRECAALEIKVRDGETYVYCAELLDFLHGGTHALKLNPSNLANALAGLPEMRWRQSVARCSKMRPDVGTQYSYAVFNLIDRIFRRMGARLGNAPVDSFRLEFLKLPKNNSYPRESLCEYWRDLRLAIEEVRQKEYEEGFIPYAITSAFLKNLARPKTSVENILDAQEKLVRK